LGVARGHPQRVAANHGSPCIHFNFFLKKLLLLF
jgi:hypothetical protein